MIREWLGDEPRLKATAFFLLLPLMGVNAFLMVVGIWGLVDPSPWFPGLGFIVLGVGAIGLGVQLTLMNLARRDPGTAGAILLLIAFVLFVFGALGRLLWYPFGWLFLLSPIPGAALLIVAAWWHARIVTREQTAWRSSRPSGQ